jgi:hypothetical protein
MLKCARKKRRKDAWKSLHKYRSLSDEERRLEARVRALEGSFARHEFFRFLKSRRYALTPLSLANAAGFPYMGWHHSMWRNAKVTSVVADGITYEIFKAIRYVAASASKRQRRHSSQISVGVFLCFRAATETREMS